LNTRAPRVLCVLRPLKLVIENYPEGPPDQAEELDAPYFPHDVGKPGSRKLPFSRELWIEREDFAEEPPRGYHRLAPGREVRLRYGYLVRCVGVERDPATGEVAAIRCTYDPETRGGAAPDGRKVQGTIHWVSAAHAREVEVRLYDRLFTVPRPSAGEEDYRVHLNPASLEVVTGARLEPAAAGARPGSRFQFERQGYFTLDPKASAAGRPVFNRTVTLRDTWAKITERTEQEEKAREGVAELRPAGPSRPSAPAASVAPAASATPAAPAAPAASGRPRDPRGGLSGDALARFDRYTGELALAPADARVLAEDPARARLFEAALEACDDPRAVANWLVHDLPRALAGRPPGETRLTGRALGELVALAAAGALSSTAAREVLDELVESGGDPREIVRRRGLEQVSDQAALERAVDRALADHPAEAARLRAGEAKLQGFFVGQVMRATSGKANPELVQRLLRGRSREGYAPSA
jgi:glutaminyl-tRNA synthetase